MEMKNVKGSYDYGIDEERVRRIREKINYSKYNAEPKYVTKGK